MILLKYQSAIDDAMLCIITFSIGSWYLKIKTYNRINNKNINMLIMMYFL